MASYPYSSELETMPLEFRFRPSDYEIIEILKREEWKSSPFITYVDIYNGLDPSILKEQYGTSRSDELYFVTILTKRYKRGPQPLRLGPHGHWKPSGAPVMITNSGKPTNGIRRTLIFHKGPNMKGEKSEWRMHEFSLREPITDNPLNPNTLEVVLCKMYEKCKCASIKEEPKLQIEYADSRNVKQNYTSIDDLIALQKNMVLTSSQESVTHTTAPSYGYSCSESWGQSNNNTNAIVSYQTYHEGLNDGHVLNDENTTNSVPTKNQWNYYDFSSG